MENISTVTGKVPVQYCLARSSLHSYPKDHYSHPFYLEKLQTPKEEAEAKVRFFSLNENIYFASLWPTAFQNLPISGNPFSRNHSS